MQMTAALQWQSFDLLGADVRLAQVFDEQEAQRWFERLDAEIPWERHRLRLFGRELQAPRLSCWIGDVGANYRYSGTRYEPRAWTPAAAELREYIFLQSGERCNSVLANLYRDGSDSMDWHSDAEAELGPEPEIWSFSFGAQRRFRLRHRHNPALRLELALPSGSLLYMGGMTQALYRHSLPKTVRQVGPRINLTYRKILAA
jgi:alkylated DNA repair dioxygenase AlkB